MCIYRLFNGIFHRNNNDLDIISIGSYFGTDSTWAS